MKDPLLITKDQLDQYPILDPSGNELKLIEAIRNRKLIIFYGAGVSMLGGAPSWKQLAREILTKLDKAFLPGENAALGRMIDLDPRKAITICRYRARLENMEDIYFDALQEKLAPSSNPTISRRLYYIHDQLRQLNALAYLTTNVDEGMACLGKKLVRESVQIFDCTTQEVRATDLKNGNVIYLHGCLNNLQNAIFTVDQYAAHYNTGSKIIPLLNEAFNRELTVLFVGYSLADHEIVQSILWAVGGMSSSIKSASPIAHYLLRGITVEEYAQFRLESDYFSSMSIRSLPYFIDYDNHDRLLGVIQRLYRLVQDSQLDSLSSKKLIDDL